MPAETARPMTDTFATSLAPSGVRRGLALALSGGGFRATLFHLGALRRLNELGVLTSVDIITSVSGGSLMAACLADAMMASPPKAGAPLGNFDALAAKVHELTSYNLRRTILLKKALPQNWGRSLPELVAKELEKHVTEKSLTALPPAPTFVFCATDMVFGVNWIYTRDRAGDFQAGYSSTNLGAIGIAHAAAASACFPPIFAPISTLVDPTSLQGGMARGPDADRCRKEIRLSDGGVYDNMGLEPSWKGAATLLVSDAGGPFEFARDRGTLADIKRYPDIMGNQARALRKRWLIDSYVSGIGPGGKAGFGGTYWSTGGSRVEYDKADTSGYSKATATMIAHIRTDLNTFSEAETAILENHGYLMTDVALKVHASNLWRPSPPAQPPFPAWLDDSKAQGALKDSAKQKL
ncbi:MAG TPA: patatin-like phospholipase family protein [Gemmatimonadaceae bacterium]|nr:patatin-like phospholipase family protein [Gemmatimonadaceae bacterium]